MGSEPDDDARSFGSEPDFAAMYSLRIASETDAGPSPTGHVFDELLEDPPRPFDHDLREAEATSLQALLDGFDTLLRREDDDEDDDDEGEGRGQEETTGVRDASRPRRVRSDRQNEMVPVPELARRWRRITRRDALHDAGSTRGATSGPAQGVVWVPTPPVRDAASTSGPKHSDPIVATSSSSPWIDAMAGPAGEWWCAATDAPGFFTVTGHARDVHSRVPYLGGDTDADDGDDVETFVTDAGSESNDEESLESRRWSRGVPSIDPKSVIALDIAFTRGEVHAGEVEPRPAAMRHTTHDVVVFDDDGAMKNLWGTAPKETWSECSEFSEAGSDDLRVYGLDSQGS
jgi:hypothetical protein